MGMVEVKLQVGMTGLEEILAEVVEQVVQQLWVVVEILACGMLLQMIS